MVFKKRLKDFGLTVLCFPLINVVVHEIGHLLPIMLTDVRNMKWTITVGSWAWSGSELSGLGLIPVIYLAAIIVLMGGAVAGIVAFLLYRKLEFLNYPILKMTMLFSAISQWIYAWLELCINAEWVPFSFPQSITISWAIATPIVVIYLLKQVRKKRS